MGFQAGPHELDRFTTQRQTTHAKARRNEAAGKRLIHRLRRFTQIINEARSICENLRNLWMNFISADYDGLE
jgi:hypothetical protein